MEILDGIREWVELESPTHDKAAVDGLMDRIQEQVAGIGASVNRIPVQQYGDHLLARWGGDGPGVLLLSHVDTVWPLGSKRFYVDGDRAYGPGILDMKGGAYLAYHAVRTLVSAGRQPPLPVTMLINSDEEVGSPTSRELIEREASRNRYVLVFEPAGSGGAVKTSRKGWGRFNLRVGGRAAHAGADHESGRNAIAEMARHILELEGMTDYSSGTTVNVGVVRGGTRLNVVPAEAEAEIDLRVATAGDADRMIAVILGLSPTAEGFSVEATGGMNRPPFERAMAAELYTLARTCAAELGFDLPEEGSGGVSDGNITAAVGVPTLDGLGVVGVGSHAEDEHLVISQLEGRVALIVRLLEKLR